MTHTSVDLSAHETSTREDERARIVGDLLARVLTLRSDERVAIDEIRMAIRTVLDLDTVDSARWLYPVWVDEDGDEYALHVWDRMGTHVCPPSHILVREYVWTDEAGTYVPRTRVYVPSLYDRHEDDHECVRVDLPRDWHEDI